MITDNQTLFYGWDIGGAHLKVACADASGKLLHVVQFPCALWRGIAELEIAFSAALTRLPLPLNSVHAVTMTGELVDAFTDRQQGVERILRCVSSQLPFVSTHIYAGQAGWLSIPAAITQWQDVASMNWHASARFAASQIKEGLFIDIGSTTCDIIALSQNTIQPRGLSDYDRQRHRELVYTGAIRTPLMSIADAAPLQGVTVPLSAEWFATTADIWLLLNKLSADNIQDASADNQPWDKTHAQRRLARMLSTDAGFATESDWRNVARWFAEKQLQIITEACLTVLSVAADNDETSPIIGAGVGKFMVRLCAQRLSRPYIDYSELCFHHQQAAVHAPAAALALLAYQQLT